LNVKVNVPGGLGGLCPMMKTFHLLFHETKFTVPKENLSSFFNHHPDLIATTSYEVKSRVPPDIFQIFVKGLELKGSKISVAKENAESISHLATEFWLGELLLECSDLLSSSSPELTTAPSE
jgi:hypothetical protein